jgi:hypothetical protein
MKTFEIWVEGYNATGNSSPASKVGQGVGETFDDAIQDYINHNPDCGINNYDSGKSKWNIWGCNLFDNEMDARKAFG